jgi:dihydroorotase
MPARARSRPTRDGPTVPPDAAEWVLAGRGFYQGRLQPLEVGISSEGWIVAVGRNLRAPRRHDVGDRLILPTATDLHVHFRSPVPTKESIESWGTGTVQAALGGVGLVGEMPNSVPPVTSAEALRERRAAGHGRLAVDMLLYGAVTTRRRVAALGRLCGAFKLYIAPTTGIEPEAEPEPLEGLLEAVAETGLPLTVHAEDPSRFHTPAQLRSTVDWNEARPPEAELEAVRRLLQAAPPNLRLHVAHVTCTAPAELLAARGHSYEATPQHLLLAARSSAGSLFKVNPPLRPEPLREALWTRFAAGGVPILASDHAPHALELKDRPFPLAPSGMPGVATMLPLLLERSRKGSLPLEHVVRAACDRPARWLGQPLGRIAVGHRADLLVVDPKRRRVIRAEQLPAPCGWSAFEGWEALFPQEHYRLGELLVEDGEYVGRPHGQFVRPEYARTGGSAPAPSTPE